MGSCEKTKVQYEAIHCFARACLGVSPWIGFPQLVRGQPHNQSDLFKMAGYKSEMRFSDEAISKINAGLIYLVWFLTTEFGMSMIKVQSQSQANFFMPRAVCLLFSIREIKLSY